MPVIVLDFLVVHGIHRPFEVGFVFFRGFRAPVAAVFPPQPTNDQNQQQDRDQHPEQAKDQRQQLQRQSQQESHPILGKDVLDSEDFLVSGLLLPIGSLVYLLFCVSKWGWGFDKYVAEANKGKGLKFAKWLKPYFQFILPALIVVIFLQGLL